MQEHPLIKGDGGIKLEPPAFFLRHPLIGAAKRCNGGSMRRRAYLESMAKKGTEGLKFYPSVPIATPRPHCQ
jgi:hypothetical protein